VFLDIAYSFTMDMSTRDRIRKRRDDDDDRKGIRLTSIF
jgi:hypothetical protein